MTEKYFPMLMRVNVLLFLAVISFSACKPSREKAAANVTASEEVMKKSYQSGKPDQVAVLAAVDAYDNFVKAYPKDTMSPTLLMRAGDSYRLIKQYDKAILEYQKVEKDYQSSKVYPNSVFVQAFVYENEIKDLTKAKERYETFIKLFPNHELAGSAQYSLQNLGVPPEELVRRFEQQNKAAADTSKTVELPTGH